MPDLEGFGLSIGSKRWVKCGSNSKRNGPNGLLHEPNSGIAHFLKVGIFNLPLAIQPTHQTEGNFKRERRLSTFASIILYYKPDFILKNHAYLPSTPIMQIQVLKLLAAQARLDS